MKGRKKELGKEGESERKEKRIGKMRGIMNDIVQQECFPIKQKCKNYQGDKIHF